MFTKLSTAMFLCFALPPMAMSTTNVNLINCQGTQGSLVSKCQIAHEHELAPAQAHDSDFFVDYRMTCNRNYRGPKPSFISAILENGQSLNLQFNNEVTNILVGTGVGPLVLRDVKPVDLLNLQFNDCQLIFRQVTVRPSARVVAEREAEKTQKRAVRSEYLRLTQEQVKLNIPQLVGQQSTLYFRVGQRTSAACLIHRYETDPLYLDLIADIKNNFIASFGSDLSVSSDQCASRMLPKPSLRGMSCDIFTIDGIQKLLARNIPQEDRFFYETCLAELNYNALLIWFEQKQSELSKIIAEVEVEGLADIKINLLSLLTSVQSVIGSSCTEITCQAVEVNMGGMN